MNQDWKPIVFKKDTKTDNKNKQNKFPKGPQINSKFIKVDNTEIEKIKKVELKTGRVISQNRTRLKLSQKEFAQRINVKQDIINQYENAKAIPNQNILNKMERILGVYLTGSKIGQSKNKKYN